MSGGVSSRRVFLDTNIFVYLLDRGDPAKQARAESLVHQTIAEGSAVTSYQVAQEFLSVATRKFRSVMSSEEALAYVARLVLPCCEVNHPLLLYARALSIVEKTGWTFYDALIVSAALEAGCEVLYTEDLQTGRIFEGLEIRNPFA